MTTVTDTKTSLKSLIRAALNFIALIPSRSIRHMLANFARAEFVKTVSNFRKKKKVIALCSRSLAQNVN